MLAAAELESGEAELNGTQILEHAKAGYPKLAGYRDRASVLKETQLPGSPLVQERHAFTTVYRPPRDFRLVFDEDPAAGGERYVLWSDPAAVYTWWSTTGITDTYPPGRGAAAFGVSAYPTHSAVLMILPLIYPSLELSGPITDVHEAELDGEEAIDGHPCYRLRSVARSAYGSGRGVSLRSTTLWIDKHSWLIRRVFQDTRQGALAGSIDLQTTDFAPEANPELHDNDFLYTPPPASP